MPFFFSPRPRPRPSRRDRPSRIPSYRSYFFRRPSPPPKLRKPRRRSNPPRYLLFFIYLLSLSILIYKFIIIRTYNHPSPIHSVSQNLSLPVSAASLNVSLHPPQFGVSDRPTAAQADPVHLLDDSLADDDLDVPDDTVITKKDNNPTTKHAVTHTFRQIDNDQLGTRTCYHSSATGEAVCVHVPFCVRHSAIVYLADSLRCAIYSNRQGKPGTLSRSRCVELEKEVENLAEIEQVEKRPQSWLDTIDREGHVLWFEGDSIFVRMSKRCKSVTHFAERIFMLHHLLNHPERYGMGAISNIVIAAEEDVARKIRYSKSWHHGLLKAIVYPNKLHYAHREIRDLVSIRPSTPGDIRVFVPNGLWDVAKGHFVPCFRRSMISAAMRMSYFLTEDKYPGIVEPGASRSPTRHVDSDLFRKQVFESLGFAAEPRMRREVVYLHRTKTRTFGEAGLDRFESKIKSISRERGWTYRKVDVGGMTFPEQVQVVAGVGLVIGVHGTQMLNSIFVGGRASIVELFPYGFANTLFEGGSGGGKWYKRYEVMRGEEWEGIDKWNGDVGKCVRESRECRRWYQSDERKIEFGALDAEAIGKMVEQAMASAENGL